MMMHCKVRSSGDSIAVRYTPTAVRTMEAIFEHAGMQKWAAKANVAALNALISDTTTVESDLHTILCKDGRSMSNFCKRELSDHIEPLAAEVAVSKPMLAGFGMGGASVPYRKAEAAANAEPTADPALDTLDAAIFNLLDLNKDGSVSKAELAAELKKPGGDFATLLEDAGINTAVYVLEQMDADGNGNVDLNEFKVALRSSTGE